MKLYACLCAFSNNDKLGGYVLSLNGELPKVEIYDISPPILDLIKQLCCMYCGIDKDWPIWYHQSMVHEQIYEERKSIIIVYTCYFPDIPSPLHGSKWIKLNDRFVEMDEHSVNIINYTAIQRI